MQSVSLYELNNLVSQLIEQALPDEVWVTGELAEGRPGSGGHFYGELVQKDARGVCIIARARITIWARNYNMIRVRFARETGSELRAGMKVQLLVRVTFHEQYGYSLNVLDVDSSYTLGDMARRRQEILRQLEEDGIIDDNRTLPFPTLLRRIAVISSDKAAGYGDFCDQLLNNEYGLRFHVQLFSATMQGTKVEETILSALDKIMQLSAPDEIIQLSTPDDILNKQSFDAVVIIRGGGAVTDLSDFDSYALAAAIAQFPIPVFTGIGHDRDETVLDRVANRALKTPTAVAAFILDYQLAELNRVQELESSLPRLVNERLQREKHRLELLEQSLPTRVVGRLQREQHRVELLANNVPVKATMLLQHHRHRLDMLELRLKSLDPELLLHRGYSITMVGGKVLKDASQVAEGEVIVTKLANGELYSKVL